MAVSVLLRICSVPWLTTSPPRPAPPPPPPPQEKSPPAKPRAVPPVSVKFCSVRLPALVTSKSRIVVPAAESVRPLLPAGPVTTMLLVTGSAVGPPRPEPTVVSVSVLPFRLLAKVIVLERPPTSVTCAFSLAERLS